MKRGICVKDGIRTQAVIVPVYQPTDKLLPLVRSLAECFAVVIVVNDGSDETYQPQFDEIGGCFSNCKVLRHYPNLGKGRALKTAFNACLVAGGGY